MKIRQGLPAALADQAAGLYWQAFGAKLGAVLGPHDRALAFIARVMRRDHAICALSPNDELLGVAGFKTHEGAFVGGDLSDLRAIYGPVSGTFRGLLLSLLERDVVNNRLLMDGLFVSPGARGQGVGTALLDAIEALATDRGYEAIRLDVITENTRARSLYERRGFELEKTSSTGLLSRVFGFSGSHAMIKKIP